MANKFQVIITAVDKTAQGIKSANKNFGGFAKFAEKVSGGSKLGDAARKLSSLSRSAGEASSMLEGAAAGLGEAGAAAGAAATGIGIVAVAAAAGAAAAFEMSNRFTAAGASLERTSAAIGVSVADIQALGGAAQYSGVRTEDMTASLDALGQTLNDARWGRNPMAQAMLRSLGVSVKVKNGMVDTKQAMLDIADALARQHNPQTQAFIAQTLGLSRALPALRNGAVAFQRDMARYKATGAAMDEKAARASVEYQQRLAEMGQKWAAVKRQVGEAALPIGSFVLDLASSSIGGIRDFFSWMGRVPDMLRRAWSGLGQFFADLWAKATGAAPGVIKKAAEIKDRAVATARGLTHQAAEAGRSAIRGAEAFFSQIERQESRGRQFDRQGRPLTSSAGAVGVMQLLPSTAALVARRLGVGWDPSRFRSDASYNRMLGQAELSRLLRKYGGDMTLAAAAYNAGEGWLDGFTDKRGRRHAGWLHEFGDPRRGKLTDAEFAVRIPFAETRKYVQAFTGQGRLDVNIQLAGAPPGTRVSSQASPGVDHTVRVDRAMPAGAPAV